MSIRVHPKSIPILHNIQPLKEEVKKKCKKRNVAGRLFGKPKYLTMGIIIENAFLNYFGKKTKPFFF